MVNKKFGVFLLALISLSILSSFFVSATLDIQKQEVAIMAVKDLNMPAIFNLQITNLGENDTFNIYNLVGLEMTPNESFDLAKGATKSMVVEVYPTLKADYQSFEYKINGLKAGIQNDELAIIIVDLKDVFNFYADEINPDSSKAVLHFDNRGAHAFENVKVELSSPFFTKTEEFASAGSGTNTLEVALDKDKIKNILAGSYVINAKITVKEVTSQISTIIKFNEKPEVKTIESSEGIFLQRYEVEKKNLGNTKNQVSVVITKDLISSLFTSITPAYDKREMKGFNRVYTFQKEISPDESFKVVVKTNWWLLVLIIVVIILGNYLINKYIREKLVIKKTIQQVRTRGGEFALKVNIQVKARDYVEKIRIVDRIPSMVKLFDQYGLTRPDRIDERLKMLEWNVSGMSKGEERVFSYIVYSKIGVVGKFELPQTGVIYEYLGKIREATSNVAFFINKGLAQAQ